MRATRLVIISGALGLVLLPLILALILSRVLPIFQFDRAQAQVAIHQAEGQAGRGQSKAAPLRFVDSSNQPIAKNAVWVLCYADNSAQTLIARQWVQTDGDGYLLTPLPATCTWLAALLPLYEQPSTKPEHGPAFWVFAASWPTNARTPASASACNTINTILCAADGDVVIRQEWPLVLFNVVASLEWEPEPGSKFVDQLTDGLQAASPYLADLTDGAMAFGPLTIHTGGRNWAGADLRLQVANNLRPSTYVGGIVTQTTVYSPTRGQLQVYRPATIFLGRTWNRHGAFAGAWDEPDGYRTIVHEWAHYALFLNDEYQTNRGAPIYCTRDDIKTTADEGAASAMAWHYTASELWHPDHLQTPDRICLETDQFRHWGQSDWETLAVWHSLVGVPFPILSIPGKAPNPSLSLEEIALLQALFGQPPTERLRLYLPVITAPGGANATPFSQTITVHTDDNLPTKMTQTSHVYLLQGGSTAPSHILYQGAAQGDSGAFGKVGQITLLGAHEGDEVRVFVDRYALHRAAKDQTPGGSFVYPVKPQAGDLSVTDVVAQRVNMSATLNLSYGMTRTGDTPAKLTRLVVTVSVSDTLPVENLTAQLCVSDAEIGCPSEWSHSLTRAKRGVWFTEFAPLTTMAELPLYSVVRVTATNPEFTELIRWVRDAGAVGPGHKPTNASLNESAPQTEGVATVQTLASAPVTEPCNRLIVMPAASSMALATPPGVGVQIVATPLDLDILLGAIKLDQNGRPLCDTATGRDLRLTLFYNQEDLTRLGISEADELNHLTILHFEATAWKETQVGSLVDPDLNSVATTIQSGGIYAIAYKP